MNNHRKSLIKRSRKHGFRCRQRTSKGHLIHAHKRRVGRTVNVKWSFS
jgi:ribosomal protein L34